MPYNLSALADASNLFNIAITDSRSEDDSLTIIKILVASDCFKESRLDDLIKWSFTAQNFSVWRHFCDLRERIKKRSFQDSQVDEQDNIE